VKTVLQRVARAEVRVDGEIVGRIDRGVLLLVGVAKGDTEADADATADKVAGLRIFAGRTPMDLDLAAIGGACLVVSQFTLCAVLDRGRRPGFDGAEEPARAKELYERVADRLRGHGLPVATGRFGATMAVELENDGPVTLLVFTENGRVVLA
jgi:D-tyrosyl-tRNA(Tyr) deacylase